MDITHDIILFIEQHTDECNELRKGFYELEQKKWTAIVYWSELFIQLQHFIFATSDIKSRNAIKESFRNICNIEDEICDVIYQIINILKIYKLKIESNMICNLEYDSESELKEICVVLCGQIGDAILRIDLYKHNNGRTIFLEKELILKNCFYIMYLMFQYAHSKNINIRNAFNEMTTNAKNYILSFNQFDDGVYSLIEKKEIVVKNIKLNKEWEFGFKINNYSIINDIWQYIEQLRFEKIRVIRPFSINKQDDNIIIEQLYIKGTRLDDFIKIYINNMEGINVIQNIFIDIVTDILMLYKSNENIRVDSNLCNFIINDLNNSNYTINLVDIYPPVFINKTFLLDSNRLNFVYELTTDIQVSITAFLYYYIKNILIGIQADTKEDCIMNIHKAILELVDFTENKLKSIKDNGKTSNKYSTDYFMQKIFRMLKYFDLGTKEKEELIDEIKLWSIRKEYKK